MKIIYILLNNFFLLVGCLIFKIPKPFKFNYAVSNLLLITMVLH